MIKKQVKQYGNRQRIEINKTDNLDAGAKVIILSENEYNTIMKNLQDLEKQNIELTSQLNQMHNQDTNIKEMLENTTSHLYEKHQKEIENKDNEIKELRVQINAMRKSIIYYIIQLSALNVIDFFRSKHKKIIESMNDAIFSDADADAHEIDADAKKLNK
jgi:predicted RNase H-like nuclease (RuvC/YqgF family)